MTLAWVEVTDISRRALAALSALTDEHHEQRLELAASGVPDRHVSALYPFDLADHAPKIWQLLSDKSNFQALSQLLGPFGIQSSLEGLLHAERMEAKRLLGSAPVPTTQLIRHTSKLDSVITSHSASRSWMMLLVFFHVCGMKDNQQFLEGSEMARRLQSHVETSRGLIAHFPPAKR